MVQYSCDPERVDELSGRVREIVDSWRTAPPENRYAQDIAASQNRSFSENLERNDWWLGQIAFSVITGVDPSELMNRRELYASLTPQVLSDAANDYLVDDRYLEAVLYPDPLALQGIEDEVAE
jgi:zinc protease